MCLLRTHWLKILGPFLLHSLGLRLNVLKCCLVNIILVKFISIVWAVCAFFTVSYLVCVRFINLSNSSLSFFKWHNKYDLFQDKGKYFMFNIFCQRFWICITKILVSQIHKNTVMMMNTLSVYRSACSPIQHWCL